MPHFRQESVTRFAFLHRLRNKIKGVPLLGFFEKGLSTVVGSVAFPHPRSFITNRHQRPMRGVTALARHGVD